MSTLWAIKCDGCGETTPQFEAGKPDGGLPDGWRSIELNEQTKCTLTHLLKLDLCPACVKRALDFAKKELPERTRHL